MGGGSFIPVPLPVRGGGRLLLLPPSFLKAPDSARVSHECRAKLKWHQLSSYTQTQHNPAAPHTLRPRPPEAPPPSRWPGGGCVTPVCLWTNCGWMELRTWCCVQFRSLKLSLISAGVGRSRSGTSPLIYSGRSVFFSCASASVLSVLCCCDATARGQVAARWLGNKSRVFVLLWVFFFFQFCFPAEVVCLPQCVCVPLLLLKAGLCANTWSLTGPIPTCLFKLI